MADLSKITYGDKEFSIPQGGGGGTVDQHYNAYSENAQSGTAVAEATADMASYSADTSSPQYNGVVSHGNDSIAFTLDTDAVSVTMASPSVYYSEKVLPTKGYVDTELAEKQDALVSGTNIKTIGNVDLLGSGAVNVATINNKSLLDGGNVSTAKITYDAEYQTTQIRDDESNAEIMINKVDGNTLNINEYAPDSRGQSQEVFNMNLPTKDYVDGQTGDLSALTTTAQTDLVSAVNELKSDVDGLGEPFRVKNWAGTFDISIPFCTEDIANSSIPKIVFSIDDVEGADYQIVGMVAYEVFDAASGGNRVNCWPVCQFTGNGQKELSVRLMCAGTTRKAAKRINAWVLLKHR